MSFPVQNIRTACALKGITLAELERELGIGNGVIARWETSKNSPPYDRLVAIANRLETTVSALSTPPLSLDEAFAMRPDAKKEPSPVQGGLSVQQLELISLVSQLTDEDVAVLSAAARAQIEARKGRDDQ